MANDDDWVEIVRSMLHYITLGRTGEYDVYTSTDPRAFLPRLRVAWPNLSFAAAVSNQYATTGGWISWIDEIDYTW